MTAEALLPIGVMVAVVMLVVAWIMIRRPMQRRLAIRDALRRPGETVLVVVGSLLGTALIAGSFIVGDTLDESVKQSAYKQLGPVDEVITVLDPAQATQIEDEVAAIDDPRIEGVMSAYSSRAAIASSDSGQDRAEPDGQLVEFDFAAAQEFGDDPAATGVSGTPPDEGAAVITDDLANELQVEPGDSMIAYLYGEEIELEVDRILPQLGLAGFWTGFESTSPNAFVSAGTIDSIVPDELPEGSSPPATHVLISNRGDVEGGAELSDDVAGLIEEELGTTAGVRVQKVKQDLLEGAEEAGNEFGQLFLNIGLFAIIAGILLLVNIFVMLSEERKGQLGMLRAVGMKRSDLVRVFIIEGAFYSLIAGILGAIAGIGVGWAIVKLAAPIFGGFGDFSLELTFAADIESILGGLFIGILISMITIVFTSFRISRINIIRAIRDIQEPKLPKSRTRTVVLGSVVAALALAWFAASLGDKTAFLPALLGPPVAVYALIPLAGRVIGKRKAVIIAALAGLVWGIFGNTLLDGQFFDSGELVAFVLQGVMLTFSAVMLLSQTQENLEGVIRRVAAGYLSLRLSIAYPLARRFRTGLTLGMYSLVIFTMTFIAVLSAVFGGQVETATRDAAGGFDISATASRSNPPSVEQIEEVEGVERVAAMRRLENALFQPEGFPEPEPWFATGIDATFAELGGPILAEYDEEEFDSESAVWQEVLANPDVMIVPSFFLQQGGGPPANVVELGDDVTALNPVTGEESTRTVVAILDNDFIFAGAYMSNDSLEAIGGGLAPLSYFQVRADEGADPVEVADTLQGELVQNGLEADTFRALVEENLSANLQFFRLMQAYLALGLIVGIAGLGVVMIRAVRDRRREIGVLWSLGFVPPRVRRAFLLESGFIALEGILVGSILALITASQLVENGDFGETAVFTIPWFQVSLVCGLAFIASLFAAAWPAQKASKIAPAVALRVAD
jgi:putative ABC transport system permease protein